MFKFISEIKNRIFLVFLTWISVFIINYYYKEILLFTFFKINSYSLNQIDYYIFTNISELFLIYLKLSLFLSIQTTVIFIIYHSFHFFSYGCFILEYYYISCFLIISLFVWLTTLLLTKFLLLPLMFTFFFQFQSLNTNIYFEAKIDEYFEFYTNFYTTTYLYSQIFILFLGYIYFKINSKFIQKFRRLFYYNFVLFSTFVSPPDIFSQFLISFMLIIFYELFVYLFIFKKSAKNVS